MAHVYNAANRRAQTLQGANRVDYRYNGFGQRVQKFGSSVPTRHYLYNSDGSIVGEYTDAGAPVLEMVKLGDLPIAALTPAGTLYAQADHLNTVRALQNATGVTVWRWESDPFGAALPDEDPDGNGVATVFPLRFPGQYYDAETGTHYNYHRDYDPQMGRYTQADPLGVAGGLNVYAYVGNDPLRMVDPLGLERSDVEIARRILIANNVAGDACWEGLIKEPVSLSKCANLYAHKMDCDFGANAGLNRQCMSAMWECQANVVMNAKALACADSVSPRKAIGMAEYLLESYADRKIGYCD